MKKRQWLPFVHAFSFGWLAGMRGMAGPAFLSRHTSQYKPVSLQHSTFNFMADAKSSNILQGIAATELLIDKIPGIPDRVHPALLVFRSIAGGLAGTTIFAANRKSIFLGALTGIFGAVVGSFAFLRLRRAASRKLKISEQAMGIPEDLLILGMGAGLNRSLSAYQR
jgi:uncharacterized membrane protein